MSINGTGVNRIQQHTGQTVTQRRAYLGPPWGQGRALWFPPPSSVPARRNARPHTRHTQPRHGWYRAIVWAMLRPVRSVRQLWQEKGQSLIELALILPLMLTILAGLTDAGRALRTYMIITNAAREAARYAAIHPDDVAGAINRGLEIAEQGGLSPSQVTITVTVGASGEPAIVQVSTQFTPLFLGFLWNQPLTLSATAQMIVL